MSVSSLAQVFRTEMCLKPSPIPLNPFAHELQNRLPDMDCSTSAMNSTASSRHFAQDRTRWWAALAASSAAMSASEVGAGACFSSQASYSSWRSALRRLQIKMVDGLRINLP